MFDKLKKSLQEATDLLREQAASLGEGAKEKSFQLIEEWLLIFPKLEDYGLQITSFGLSVAISPALEVELQGKHTDFPMEKLQAIMESNRGNPAILSVMSAIKTAYSLHRKIHATQYDPLLVKIRLRLSPEIKVFIGMPIIQ